MTDLSIIIIGYNTQNSLQRLLSSINLQKLNQKTNVDFIGYVKPTNLARYIKKFDVAILPYLENDFTKGIVPLKLYEYIAAGIPVVAANLPSVEKLAKETSLFSRFRLRYKLFLVKSARYEAVLLINSVL